MQRRLGIVISVVLAAVWVPTAAAAPLGDAGAASVGAAGLPATLELAGHGWGHGYGMGAYGALGYAEAGWSYTEILSHYYGGTVLRTVSPSSTIDVHLQELDGFGSITVSAAAGTQLLVDGKLQARTSVTLTRSGVGPDGHGFEGRRPDCRRTVVERAPPQLRRRDHPQGLAGAGLELAPPRRVRRGGRTEGVPCELATGGAPVAGCGSSVVRPGGVSRIDRV